MYVSANILYTLTCVGFIYTYIYVCCRYITMDVYIYIYMYIYIERENERERDRERKTKKHEDAMAERALWVHPAMLLNSIRQAFVANTMRSVSKHNHVNNHEYPFLNQHKYSLLAYCYYL